MKIDTVRKLGALALAAMVGCALIAGCSSSAESSSSAAESSISASSSAESASSEAASSEAAVTPDLELGNAGDTAKDVYFKNSLGKEVIAVMIVPAGSDADADNLLAQGETWADGKTALVHVDSTIGACDIRLICSEDAYVLHNVDAGAIESIVEVMLEGDVAYMAFEKDGSMVTSRNEEVALHEAAVAAMEEVAAQAAQAEAAAQAAAQEEAAAQAAPAQDYYYDDSAANTGGGYEQPAQTQDSCVEGGVALR